MTQQHDMFSLLQLMKIRTCTKYNVHSRVNDLAINRKFRQVLICSKKKQNKKKNRKTITTYLTSRQAAITSLDFIFWKAWLNNQVQRGTLSRVHWHLRRCCWQQYPWLMSLFGSGELCWISAEARENVPYTWIKGLTSLRHPCSINTAMCLWERESQRRYRDYGGNHCSFFSSVFADQHGCWTEMTFTFA